MAAELKPYPAYKDSGVPWLGKVPTHWKLTSLKWVSDRSQNGSTPPTSEMLYYDDGVVPWYGPSSCGTTEEVGQPIRHLSQFAFEKGSARLIRGPALLIVVIGATAGRMALMPKDGSTNQQITAFEFSSDRVSPSFILRQLRSAEPWLRSTASSATIPILDSSVVARLPCATPPLPEQTAIVRFLDHADRRIRRYIRAKQKLIALLEEQKQAIIHQAVTGQIDVRTGHPYPAYKPSGVEWLGEVPVDWEVKRVKQAAQVLRGKFTHRPRNDPSLYDGPYPFIQTGEVARAERAITSYRQTLNERGLAISRMFPAGTLVMTIAANIGDVAVLDFEACFPDSVVGFVPRGGIERDFLYYVFRAMRPELLREAPVNTQGNLNVDRIGSRGVAVAPAHEQRLVVQQIEVRTAGLNTATNRANRKIDLLHEYRTRLIADVVTGKLDVREAAAALPEVDPLAAADPLDDPLDTNAPTEPVPRDAGVLPVSQ